MRVLAIERSVEGTGESRIAPLLRREASRVWELYQQGIIRELYFRSDRHEAVLILECQDSDEAGSVLQTLPLVAEGLIAFDVIPLAPYTGFGRLFADDAEAIGDSR